MKKLTEYQKTFLLENFFKNESHHGWRDIATCLLETGSCIVVGDQCIWRGGIGNFIEKEQVKDGIGCLLYKFSAKEFLSSKWYNEVLGQHIIDVLDKKSEIEKEYNELKELQV